MKNDIDYNEVVTDVIKFLSALPDELGDLAENIQRDRPDLYERRLDLLSMNSRSSEIALQVVWEQLDREEKALLDVLIGEKK